jgi:hypothetical protein
MTTIAASSKVGSTIAMLSLVSILLLRGDSTSAAIPDAQGVIHGCMAKRTGALRIIDTEQGATCTGKQTPISWSRSAPAPAATAFHTASELVDPEGQPVLSQELPAGQYAVSAKGVATNMTANPDGAHCFLVKVVGETGDVIDESNVNLPPNQVATLALQAVIALTETSSILVICEAPGVMTHNKMTAIRVTPGD